MSEPGSLSCSRTRLLIDTFAAIAGTRPVTPSVNFCTTPRCRLMNQKGRTARDRDICKPHPQTAHTCHLNDQCEKCTSKQLTYSHTSIRSASARSLRNPAHMNSVMYTTAIQNSFLTLLINNRHYTLNMYSYNFLPFQYCTSLCFVNTSSQNFIRYCTKTHTRNSFSAVISRSTCRATYML